MSTASIGAHSRPAEPRWPAARKTWADVKRRTAEAAGTARARAWSLRRAALTIGGFACIDAAAFQVNIGTGLLATGISALVLETLGED